ncbi:hypothetical protein TcasGA2_TC007622 [Tribolium castaneum]|uniref:Uncharacterized protein n=1 Tax=Tribolium castaneum TaxID=7070 RepID=D2A2V2_TRICA|nr:hypothetical protein TcasGA2_TC007622 [Tribolium castaneum]
MAIRLLNGNSLALFTFLPGQDENIFHIHLYPLTRLIRTKHRYFRERSHFIPKFFTYFLCQHEQMDELFNIINIDDILSGAYLTPYFIISYRFSGRYTRGYFPYHRQVPAPCSTGDHLSQLNLSRVSRTARQSANRIKPPNILMEVCCLPNPLPVPAPCKRPGRRFYKYRPINAYNLRNNRQFLRLRAANCREFHLISTNPGHFILKRVVYPRINTLAARNSRPRT